MDTDSKEKTLGRPNIEIKKIEKKTSLQIDEVPVKLRWKVDGRNYASYSFIVNELRGKIAEGTFTVKDPETGVEHEFAQLPTSENIFFNIRLDAGESSSVILRFRQCDVCLVAYAHSESPDDKLTWYKFSDAYIGLEGEVKNLPIKVCDIKLGSRKDIAGAQQLKEAVCVLSNSDPNPDSRDRALATLIVMFSAAIIFKHITKIHGFTDWEGLTEYELYWFEIWNTICKCVYEASHGRSYVAPPAPDVDDDSGIFCFGEFHSLELVKENMVMIKASSNIDI